MPDNQEPPPDSVQVKLSFRVPQRMPSLYAHHMMIQPGEHEVLLSFFEIVPPAVSFENEEQLKKLQDVGVSAECVARITIAKDRFPGFVKAMKDILDILQGVPNQEAVAKTDADDKRDNQ